MTGASSRGGWQNWAGNQSSRPHAVEHPRDPEEIALIVKRARDEGRRVKAIGAGHSFTATGVTDGYLLHLDRLDGLVSSDLGTRLVTVRAGTPLHRLHPILAQLGLAMSNLGDIDSQTISGATSTGTHGTGRELGGLATQIRALELVTGDGTVVACSPTEQPELFECARIGLGALGIITSITLQCEPAFRLEAVERPMPLAETLERLDSLFDDNAHFEFYWFPHTDVALTKSNNRLEPGAMPKPLPRWREWAEDEFAANTVFREICRIGRRFPSAVPRLNRLAARTLGSRRFSAPSYEVFTSPRRVRFVEMEYAVPRAAVRDGIAAIQRVIERDNLSVSFPIEVRVAAGDDIPLSTAYGRETCYLAIHRFQGEPFEPYFRAVERELRALDGRPHWGKMHWRTAEDLRPTYPKFGEFRTMRDRCDPDRVFTNTYLNTVLGP